MAEIEIASGDFVTLAIQRFLIFSRHRGGEAFGNGRQGHATFGTLWTRERWHDGAEIECQQFGEHGVFGLRVAKQPLCFRVFRHECDAIGGAPCSLEIVDRFSIDREETAGRAIFRSHVGDCRFVGDRQMIQTRAEKLDELADNALPAKHLRDSQHEVGRSDAFLEFALELEADNIRQQHRQWLTEHRSFSLDAADAPAEHRKAVDHRGMRIRANQRVRIDDLERALLLVDSELVFLGPDRLREIFQIDLMADAGTRRNDGEIGKRLLTPFQEFVALLILLVFFRDVLAERLVVTEEVHDHRMVDHQIDRDQRIDLLGIAAECLHRVTHGRKVDHRRHTGEILHKHARGAECNFVFEGFLFRPLRKCDDIGLLDRAVVLVAQHVLEQHLHRVRQP